ncbi:hypothetical protein K438DRAFT_1805914 [Mycena galopus ATCC 62051]|nr:hypothetical protein K438DRAFT_1805914 [Mycena galopus ATCC 62051]
MSSYGSESNATPHHNDTPHHTPLNAPHMSPMVPPGIVHPSLHERPRMGSEDMMWTARRYGQFKNVQEPSHPFPASGHSSSSGHASQQMLQSAWEGTYDFRPYAGPLQPMQASVPPMHWPDNSTGGGLGNGYYQHQQETQRPHHHSNPPQHHINSIHDSTQHSENMGPMQNNGPLYSQVAAQHNGAPQHRKTTENVAPQHRAPPENIGQRYQSLRGHPQRGPFFYRGSSRPRAFSALADLPPDPEKTPTPQMPRPPHHAQTQRWRVRERPIPKHAWTNAADAPQATGVDLNLIVKVGDTVRVRPWADRYAWLEGCVEKADFSVIKITVEAPEEPGLKPLPKGVERDIYACIPPPVIQMGAPIEMIWVHARVLTPPNEKDQINIRILVGPSKNLSFDSFPTKYTLPFRRTSRIQVLKDGYAVTGKDEHPMEWEDGNES